LVFSSLALLSLIKDNKVENEILYQLNLNTMKTGDIYILGNHRLGCGDCTNAEFVKQVIGDTKLRAIVTDPPYGVAYVEGKMRKDGESSVSVNRPIQNDQLQSDEQYANFSANWLKAVTLNLASYNQIYIFNGDMMMCALRKGMHDAEVYYSQTMVWIKNAAVLARKDYAPQHEFIAYGWYGRHKMERAKGKSVMFHPRPAASKLHPTMKPIGLLRKLILDSTKIGEGVYDPFGGSGSTLIAAEHLQRKCVMLEIDPIYCETIIKRWEKVSGMHAKKEN
jgi:DNA modification methylase